jgi:antitoxin (DNA-binding transcriptional repressor) of toxin-antitoxin stability system
MSSVTLQEARTRLAELIEQLQPDEEFVITDQGKPVARVKKAGETSGPRKAGSAAGKIWIAPDFDAPLEDFKEYME